MTDLAIIRKALEDTCDALSDWACSYAPDECSEENITRAKVRFTAYGGTLARIASSNALLRQALAALSRLEAQQAEGWQPIETAPRDGSKIDLLFVKPRGRTIDCFWFEGSIHPDGGWFWRTPTWGEKGDLLPENEWHLHCYPNNMPTHWRFPPAPPPPAKGEGDG
jgi:hypothetical protein